MLLLMVNHFVNYNLVVRSSDHAAIIYVIMMLSLFDFLICSGFCLLLFAYRDLESVLQ